MVRLKEYSYYKTKNGNVYGPLRRKLYDPDIETFHISGHGWGGLRWNENGELHSMFGDYQPTDTAREFFDLVEETESPTKNKAKSLYYGDEEPKTETPVVRVQEIAAADEDIFSAWKAGYNFAKSMKG